MERRHTSPFETILSGLRADEAEAPPRRVASTPWFVAEAPPAAAAEDAVNARYRDAAGDSGAPDADPAPPSTDAGEIAGELDLAACRTVESLQARRRAFARDNHPDRLDPRFARPATLRMMIANRLIDAEIARLRAG